MSNLLNPTYFNVDLVLLNDSDIKRLGIKQVTTGVIFKTNSEQFEEGSLFDPLIFGPTGSEDRMKQFGYIDLYLPILHPFVFKLFITLNSKYMGIMEGNVKAKFNEEIGNFEVDENGQTGYEFVMQHLDKFKFFNNNSEQRDYKIKLMDKFLNKNSLFTKLLVLPAGMRDYTIDSEGTPSEDEINDLYRSVLATTNLCKNYAGITNIKNLDFIRIKIQKQVNTIFDYIFNLLQGKSRFIQGKFAKRAISYGTRNVATATPQKVTNLNKVKKHFYNTTTVGIYQFLGSITPITVKLLKEKFINNIFPETSDDPILIDSSTLKPVKATIKKDKKDKWLTVEGIASIIDSLSESGQLNAYCKADKYYLMRVRDTGNTITVYNNLEVIDDMTNIRPITYAELFYIAVYDEIDRFPCLSTRYPITGVGSINPSRIHVKTTIPYREVLVKYNSIEEEMDEYPIIGNSYYESAAVHTTKLGVMGMDFDGDKFYTNVLYTDESIREINKFLDSKEAYLSPTGKIIFSNDTDPINILVSHLTE